MRPNGGEPYLKNPGYRNFTCVLIGWSTPIGKFPHKDFTCILMGDICEKKNPRYRDFCPKKKSRHPEFSSKNKQKSRYQGFSSKKKTNPGYQDLQGKFFGRYAPDQNTELHPNGGALMASLGGREFAVLRIKKI